MNNITTYELHDESKLEGSGFIELSKIYSLRRCLYAESIVLFITIEKEDSYVDINVYDCALGQTYIPFYNQDRDKNNQVLKDVVKEYDKALGGLVKCGALKVG